MLRFLCLGSGSSGNGYCLWTEKGAILIDAGISIKTLKHHFQVYGLLWSQMRAVFVTHDHADHIKSLGRLSQDFSIPVYATELVHDGISRNYCVSPKLKSECKMIIEKDQPVTVEDFVVTAFGIPHDSTDCVGYRVEACGVRFCLITDVGHVTDRVKEEVEAANYLVLESNHDQEMLMAGPYPAYLKGRIAGPTGHLSNREAAELLAGSSSPVLKHVWLCHLSEENNHPELARKTVDAVLRSYGIVPGADFQLDVLKRKVPSEIFELTPPETP